MKILLVIESSGGGSGRHVVDLALGLIDAGHEVHLIYSPLRAEPMFLAEIAKCDQLHVCPLALHRVPHLADLGSLWRIRKYILRHGEFDVVHGHSSKAGALVRLLKLTFVGPLTTVYTPHAIRTLDPTLSLTSRMGWKTIEKLFGRFLTDAAIAVSPDEYRHICDQNIVRRERTHLVINGLTATPPDQRAQVRDRFGVTDDELCLGFVGRFAYQKAPEVLLHAFAQVAGEFSRLRLVMLGFGEQCDWVESLISESAFSDRIQIFKNESGFDCMCAFDVFVMPSRYEGMPYVLLEAAASGLPVIATSVGGVSAIVTHDENGLVVPIDSVEELSTAIRRFAGDSGLRTRLQAAAKHRSNDYRAETMTQQTIQVYCESQRRRLSNDSGTSATAHASPADGAVRRQANTAEADQTARTAESAGAK